MTTVTTFARRAAALRRLAPLAGLGLIVALVASGCARSNKTPQIIYITPPPGPTGTAASGSGNTAAPVETAPAPAITEILISDAAPDGKWKVTFKKPVIGGVPDSVAGPMNDAITNQVNGYISAFTGSSLPDVVVGAAQSTLEGDFSTAYASASIVSLRFSIVTFTSGAKSSTSTAGSINLDVTTGKTIALADLFSDPDAAVSVVASKTHDYLSNLLQDSLKWDGTASSLDFFSKAWVFTADGLQFSWNQGDIATAAAGRPSAVVAWSDLASVLKPDGPAGGFIK